MSDTYTAVRTRAKEMLSHFEEVQQMAHDEAPPTLKGPELTAARNSLREMIQAQEPLFVERLMELKYDPDLQHVLSAEPDLAKRLSSCMMFWVSMERHGYTVNKVLEGEDDAGDTVVTALPPTPPVEMTGETVLEYMLALAAWTRQAVQELWDDDVPGNAEIPEIVGKYGLGDRTQSQFVNNELKAGDELRKHWARLAQCGDYWDKAQVGSSRAKLIFQAADILRKLKNPRTDDSPATIAGLDAILG